MKAAMMHCISLLCIRQEIWSLSKVCGGGHSLESAILKVSGACRRETPPTRKPGWRLEHKGSAMQCCLVFFLATVELNRLQRLVAGHRQ